MTEAAGGPVAAAAGEQAGAAAGVRGDDHPWAASHAQHCCQSIRPAQQGLRQFPGGRVTVNRELNTLWATLQPEFKNSAFASRLSPE